jgi:hypothetical protein
MNEKHVNDEQDSLGKLLKDFFSSVDRPAWKNVMLSTLFGRLEKKRSV